MTQRNLEWTLPDVPDASYPELAALVRRPDITIVALLVRDHERRERQALLKEHNEKWSRILVALEDDCERETGHEYEASTRADGRRVCRFCGRKEPCHG